MEVVVMKARTLYKFASLYFSSLFIIAIIPFSVNFFNRTEPFLIGLPFFQFFILCYLLMNLTGLLVLFFIDDRIDRSSKSKTGGNQQ